MVRTAYSEDFQSFWLKWPGRWRDGNTPKKVGKAEAYDIWKLMDTEDRQDAINAVVSGKVKKAGTQFLPDCCRWLRRRLWEDYES